MSLPKPYYEDTKAGIVIYHGDCTEILPQVTNEATLAVTDPPFNIKYHYGEYEDDLDDERYYEWLSALLQYQAVLIHYPESIFRFCETRGLLPSKCACWAYNSNNHRQWRMVAWIGVEPDFELGNQQYKNPDDPRIAERIARGESARLYDWWYEQQVKNVSSEKTDHPCQMPIRIMKYIIEVTPWDMIVDPFMGSGTTLRAAKDLGRKAIGIEIEERYCEIAARRLAQEVLQFAEAV